MKKILKFFLVLIMLFLVALVWFYLWAKQPVLSEEQYAELSEQTENIKQPKSDSTFTVITYNIGYLSGMANNSAVETDVKFYVENMHKVLIAFNEIKADVIALQEIDFASNRSYDVNQLHQLAKNLGFQYKAKAVNWDKQYVPFPYFPPSVNFGKMESGQGYLSKFPLKKHQRIVLERVPTNPFYYDAFYIDRLAQIVETEIKGNPIALINVHLEAYDKTTRGKQTDYVKSLYEEYAAKMPTILLGDFNSKWTDENSPTVKNLASVENLVPACPPNELGIESSFTYSSGNPNQQIDYIFYDSTKLEVLDWRVIKTTGEASDHLPVMAEFGFRD